MCCFSRPVKEVGGTKIFARAGEGLGQFLVYEMRVRAKEPVAMVLPVPADRSKGEKALRFIDLKGYPQFFAQLEHAFTPPPAMDESKLYHMGMGSAATRPLPVERVGAFEASFVPVTEDFARLDERFRLPEKVWKDLPAYKDWSFAVFKLREGENQYHPMAFSFERRGNGALFFPTVHIHDGKVYGYADFDHVLYCQPGENGLALGGWTESRGPAAGFLKIEETQGIVDGARHCYRLKIKGRRPNRDTYALKA